MYRREEQTVGIGVALLIIGITMVMTASIIRKGKYGEDTTSKEDDEAQIEWIRQHNQKRKKKQNDK